MLLRVAVVVTCLLAGCASGPGCSPPRDANADLVTVALADGAIRTRTPLPYFVHTSLDRRGVVSITPFGGSPSPVASVDPRPVLVSTLSVDGSVLVGSRPSPWRLPGAAGRHLATVAGTAVVLGNDDQLRGVRLADGQPLWNARLDHKLGAKLAAVQGAVVFAAGPPAAGDPDLGNRIYAIDVRTGRLLWSRSLLPDTEVRQLVFVGNRLITAASHTEAGVNADVASLSAATGNVEWSTTLPHAWVERLDSSRNTLVVLNADVVPGCD